MPVRTRQVDGDAALPVEILRAGGVIPTGRSREIIVVDIPLWTALDGIPLTVEAILQGRGSRLFLGLPAKSTDRFPGTLGPGVEVVAGGGFVELPGRGRRGYRWAPGRSPKDLPVAVLPTAWLRKLLQRPRRVRP